MDTTRHGVRNAVVITAAGVGFAVLLLAFLGLVGATLLGGAVTAGLAGRGGVVAPATGTTPARRTTPARPASASIAPGTALWTRRYHDQTGGQAAATAMAVSPDGQLVYVTGTSAGASGQPGYATVAYNAVTGAQVWASQYNGPGGGPSQPASIAVDQTGTAVYVTGTSHGTTTGADFATVAYNAATGVQLWIARWAGPGADTDTAVAVAAGTQGGTVLVTGTSTDSLGSAQVTIAYDATTGAKLWLARSAAGYETATALAIGPLGGTVYVTGASRTPEAIDFATIAYDITTGAQQWAATYQAGLGGSDPADQPHAIAVSPDGKDVFVTGTGGQAGTPTAHDYATVGYNALTGGQLWAKTYNGPGNGLDEAHSVAVSPDSQTVYVTGASTGAGGMTDYATIAYGTAAGGQLWVSRYNATGEDGDSARVVVANPDGSTVYVTGISVSAAGSASYPTIGYDAATGAQEWGATRSDGSTGLLQSLAITRNGGILYLASTFDSDNGEFLTIAYKA